jgi:hypothetical protein
VCDDDIDPASGGIEAPQRDRRQRSSGEHPHIEL